MTRTSKAQASQKSIATRPTDNHDLIEQAKRRASQARREAINQAIDQSAHAVLQAADAWLTRLELAIHRAMIVISRRTKNA